MCVVSMIGDYWTEKTLPNSPYRTWIYEPYRSYPEQDIDLLRKDLEELKLLIKAGQRYDEQLGEPHCEHKEKVELIKKLAKIAGVSMDELNE